jgi:hypothetical protein
MENKPLKIMAFNAQTQRDEPHTVTMDVAGEYVFTAEDGSFLKFPATFTKKDIEKALKAHKEANTGQVSMAKVEAENNKKLGALKGLAFEDAEIVE